MASIARAAIADSVPGAVIPHNSSGTDRRALP
jgi:hypothetical protein